MLLRCTQTKTVNLGVNNYLIVLLMLSTSLLTACASKMESSIEAPLVVPNNWSATDAASVSGQEEVTSKPKLDPTLWLTPFDHSGLLTVMQRGIENNLDLKSSALRLQQAMRSAAIAGAPLKPTVNASVSSLQRRNSDIALAQGLAPARTTDSYDLGVDLAWEIDVWGRLSDSERAAQQTARAAMADLEAARLSLVANITRSWFQLLETQLQLGLNKASQRLRKDTHDVVESRFQSGLTSALDLHLAKNSLALSEASILDAQSRLQQSQRALEILLGEYPEAGISVDGDFPRLLDMPPIFLPADLLSRRPDIKSAWLSLQSTRSELAAAKKAFLPSLRLSANLGTSSDQFSRLFDMDYLAGSLLAALAQPIYLGGQIKNQEALLRLTSEVSFINYHQVVLSAYQEVESLLVNEKLIAERVNYLRQAADQAHAAERLAQERYLSGLTPFLQVLDAQQRDLDAQRQLLSVKLAAVVNRIDLIKALGGDFQHLLSGKQADASKNGLSKD